MYTILVSGCLFLGQAVVAGNLVPSQEDTGGDTPYYKVEVVYKSAKAINYEIGGGSTKIDFVGRAEMPEAKGEAKVESKKGYYAIEAKVEKLRSPQQFGTEYLTYVLWSISPEGRVQNLGELLLKNGKAELKVTTELQIFGLFVTAEPYYAVRTPSDVVVLDNEVRDDTKGRIYMIDSKLELLKRGEYRKLANPLNLTVDTKTIPLELYEARNALEIARAVGAENYAADTFSKAEASLKMAERYPKEKDYRNEIIRTSRQAVQIAEDSRALAIERREQEKLAKEREALRQSEEAARQQAADESARRAEAEASQRAAEESRMKAEAQEARAEQERLKAELAAAQAAAQKAVAEAAREDAEAVAARAEAEKKALRQRLLKQFSQALPTTDTRRGLVVNMGDVLFDTGKFELRPVAREKLARLAGICLAYPGLQLAAEGYTDSTGSVEFNQKLSQQRADAVRFYLVEQGLPQRAITSRGLGMEDPIASNDTAAGRQKNRRVEIIVSGEVIGTSVGDVSSEE
jgi:outer membrane protein OmpA-like peptidoglycan-associated protein